MCIQSIRKQSVFVQIACTTSLSTIEKVKCKYLSVNFSTTCLVLLHIVLLMYAGKDIVKLKILVFFVSSPLLIQFIRDRLSHIPLSQTSCSEKLAFSDIFKHAVNPSSPRSAYVLLTPNRLSVLYVPVVCIKHFILYPITLLRMQLFMMRSVADTPHIQRSYCVSFHAFKCIPGLCSVQHNRSRRTLIVFFLTRHLFFYHRLSLHW